VVGWCRFYLMRRRGLDVVMTTGGREYQMAGNHCIDFKCRRDDGILI